MNQQLWQAQAQRMAGRMEQYLLDPTINHSATHALPQAVSLARDYLNNLLQPERAVRFVLAFHPRVERWAAWASWAPALDLAIEASAEHGSLPERIRLLNARSQAARELSDYAHARQVGGQALRLAEQHRDCALLATTHNKLGLIALRQGDLTTAQAQFALAAQIGAGHVTPLELGHYRNNLGLVAVQLLDYVTAEQAFSEALRHYTAAEAELAIARVQCNLADLQQRQGQLEAVPAALLTARDLFKKLQIHHDHGLTENSIGAIHYQLHQWAEADQAYHRALAIFEQVGALVLQTTVLANLVALYVDQQDWARAERAIADSSRLAELTGHLLLLGMIYVEQGKMMKARGRPQDARAAWQAAHAAFERCGAQAEAARVLALLEELDSA